MYAVCMYLDLYQLFNVYKCLYVISRAWGIKHKKAKKIT